MDLENMNWEKFTKAVQNLENTILLQQYAREIRCEKIYIFTTEERKAHDKKLEIIEMAILERMP